MSSYGTKEIGNAIKSLDKCGHCTKKRLQTLHRAN